MSKYEQLIEERVIEIADGVSLVITASRKDKDSSPHIDVRTYIANDNYSGPTKKGINFDVEWLPDLIEILDEVNNDLEVKGL